MTLTELRYIVAVAHESHFGRAARSCHVSQPTLSVAVRKLETELGVTLFERGRNAVRLTPVGSRVVEQARRVLAETARLHAITERARDPLDGSLRVGAIHTVGPYLFPDLIPALRAIAPRMPLMVEENYTQRLGERLMQGQLDAVLVALPFELSGVEIRMLYDEPFRVVMPAGHPLEQCTAVDPQRLSNERVLLLGAGHCFRDQVLTVCPTCASHELDESALDRSLEGSSLETIRHMVASGTGVTVLPCTALAGGRRDNALLSVRSFIQPQPRRRVVLAWRSGFPRQAAIDALADALRQCRAECVEPVGMV